MASLSVPPEHVVVHDNLLERMGRGHICNLRASREAIASQYPLFNTEALADDAPVWARAEPAACVASRMRMVVLYLQHIYAGEESPVVVVSHHDALLELTGRSLRNGEHALIE
jgi:broad specificity phosphatase PhoE